MATGPFLSFSKCENAALPHVCCRLCQKYCTSEVPKGTSSPLQLIINSCEWFVCVIVFPSAIQEVALDTHLLDWRKQQVRNWVSVVCIHDWCISDSLLPQNPSVVILNCHCSPLFLENTHKIWAKFLYRVTDSFCITKLVGPNQKHDLFKFNLTNSWGNLPGSLKSKWELYKTCFTL